MPISSVHQFLTGSTDKVSRKTTLFWWNLTAIFVIVFGWLVLKEALSAEYVVQDDARQHVFWMQRFLDPQLFPNDLIADYFQSVAPAGYTAFYWIFAKLGINPIFLHKLLPPILGAIASFYCFLLTLELFPVPLAGFLSVSLLNHYLWMRDDLISATPAAFVYPLFLGFLYALFRRQLIFTCVTLSLLGLFYPQCVLIAGGILCLQIVCFSPRGVSVNSHKPTYRVAAIGLAVTSIVILLYALKSNDYGPVISATEAKEFPEFWTGGKSEFFTHNREEFWFTGQRTGIVPRFGTILPIVAGGFLPLFLLLDAIDRGLRSQGDRWFPSLQKLQERGLFLLQIIISSLVLFFLSHALLFRLHLPSRYTEHTLRMVTAIAAGIAMTVLIDAAFSWAKKLRRTPIQILPLTLAAVLIGLVVLEPTWLKRFPRTEYVIGKFPELYQFFAQQPKDILIASVADEVNNIPSFSARSILIGGEGYAVPYHKGYFMPIRERSLNTISATYTPDRDRLREFIQTYQIDFWLLEEGTFTPPYIDRDPWMMQYDIAKEAIAQLQQGIVPALAPIGDRCKVFETGRFAVLEASCLVEQLQD
jgi:hypothetical protein